MPEFTTDIKESLSDSIKAETRAVATFTPPPPMPRVFLCISDADEIKGTGVLWPNCEFAIQFENGLVETGATERFVNQNEDRIPGLDGIKILRWQVGGFTSSLKAGEPGDFLMRPLSSIAELYLGEVVEIKETGEFGIIGSVNVAKKDFIIRTADGFDQCVPRSAFIVQGETPAADTENKS